jgi:hypothetical protein
MRDPIMTYIRMAQDLERLAVATIERRQPLDPRLVHEIKELKEEVEKHGYVYIYGYERPFRLVPEK